MVDVVRSTTDIESMQSFDSEVTPPVCANISIRENESVVCFDRMNSMDTIAYVTY